jgi:hypothetical protein
MLSVIKDLLASTLRLLLLAVRVFLAFCAVLVCSAFRAIERNLRLKTIPAEDLGLPLIAARLADLPYQVESADQVARSISTLLFDAKLIHFEEQELMETNSVWFMCEGRLAADSALATFLVFRGTMSPTDAIADVMFRPEAGPNGVQCHGGFLRTVRDDATLHAKLKQHVGASTPELLIFGHSLGGALSQTIAGAGFLPKAFAGKLTIVSLGGPMIFFGQPDPSRFDDATAAARVLSVVNANDIVPRLLGCPLSFSRTVLQLFASSNSLKRQREQGAILDTLESYHGFPGYECVFLHGGLAYKVAPANRPLVLHLAEAIHPRCIADHLSYVDAAEAAAHAPEHWVAAGPA